MMIVFVIGIVVLILIAIVKLIRNVIKISKEIKDLDEEKRKKKLRTARIEKIILILLNIVLLYIAIMALLVSISIRETVYKPLIYIYPENEEVVTVEVGKKENLTCTYPKYKDEWKVKAYPNGDMVDLETNRNLYGLYWEGKRDKKAEIKEGFCVKGSDTIQFLEEKLSILGLTEREANEFIIYWLPKLESNKYNLIRFETIDEINENMPLEITPKPDTLIRVLMDYKPLNKYVDIKEQTLNSIQRTGFAVVEWGGTEVK